MTALELPDEPHEPAPLFGLEVAAELRAGIGTLGERVDELAQAIRRPAAQPLLVRQAAEAKASAAGAALIDDFGGPAQGRLWYVRRIIVGGVTRSTAAAGIADVYITSVSDVPAGGFSLADLVDSSNLTTLPSVAFYGRGELALRAPERLFVQITGGTAQQQYVANIQIEDYEEAAVATEWSL